MAYPPTLPPANRTDSTISAVNHAADHNRIALALASFLEVLGASPSAGFADLSSRLNTELTERLSDSRIHQIATSLAAYVYNTDVPTLVADLIAADPTVAAAAASAVDDAIAAENLYDGAQTYSGTEDLAVAFTDEAGFLTWLQADGDGNAPPAVRALLALWVAANLADGSIARDKLASDVSLPDDAPPAGGYSVAFTDEAGYLAELAVDEFGRVPLLTLAAWAERMIDAGFIAIPEQVDPATVLAPSRLYELVGQLHQYRHDAVIDGLSVDQRVAVAVPGYTFTDLTEGNYADGVRIKPAAAQTRTATYTVKDRAGAVVVTKTTSVVASTPPATTPRLLMIGDSITRPNNYNGLAASLLGGTTVGTRTYTDDGTGARGEGRGGWSLDNYRNRFAHPAYGDSPFLFPTGVAGTAYKGNTEFWRQVTVGDPGGYDFDGFQRIAAGWTSGSYIYGADGYPVSPSEGDVVVDPTKAAGQTFRIYTGGAWVVMPTQPVGYEFSFPKYIERFGAAFVDRGLPNVIGVMLNTNDFFNSASDEVLTTWGAAMDTLIASVRAWSSTVPIINVIAPVGGPPASWVRSAQAKHDFDEKIHKAAAYQIAKFDTDAMRANRVYLASFLGAVDDANYADYVHPADGGHAQFAPHLAGAIAYALGV